MTRPRRPPSVSTCFPVRTVPASTWYSTARPFRTLGGQGGSQHFHPRRTHLQRHQAGPLRRRPFHHQAGRSVRRRQQHDRQRHGQEFLRQADCRRKATKLAPQTSRSRPRRWPPMWRRSSTARWTSSSSRPPPTWPSTSTAAQGARVGPRRAEHHLDGQRTPCLEPTDGFGELAAGLPNPPIVSKTGLVLHLHESAINNAIDRMKLAGKTMTEEDLQAEVEGRFRRSWAASFTSRPLTPSPRTTRGRPH
ncbi:MAG: hypothetical protein CM1200mP2_57910 [Planctomycetaceae bacterium]|nr:MAG: hypothetical protein CM1200mP2_57910 [Planctomycetaceae bacterium]